MWMLCVVRSKQPLHPPDDERQRDSEDKEGEGYERFIPFAQMTRACLHGSRSTSLLPKRRGARRGVLARGLRDERRRRVGDVWLWR